MSIFGQVNLVQNPSFEIYTSCPTAFSELNKASPWYGTNNSSELFNFCGTSTANAPNTWYGFQVARTGNAYAGQYFMNGYGMSTREYIQAPLTHSLNAGDCYLVKFYVNCVNKIINYACNNFAAHLSAYGYTTSLYAATSYTPQIYLVNNPIITDTINWTEIGGIYTAQGGEKYITIGNFKNDLNTDTLRTNNGTISASYYYIDDVSTELITSPNWQLKDTIIISGDSVLIGPLYSGLTCAWFDMVGAPIGTGAGIYVKPLSTTSYVLQQSFCNSTFFDTITVYVSALNIMEKLKFSDIKIYPNPTSETLYIDSKVFIEPETQIEIITTLNQTILKSNYKSQLDISNLDKGLYLFQLKNNFGPIITKRLIVFK
jgi:hypothetical protein